MNLALYRDSWMMGDEIEEMANEAVRVSHIAFQKDRESIVQAWKRMINALEIIEKEGWIALDDVYCKKNGNDKYLMIFKEAVCAFTEYVIDTRPIVEFFLNEIYISKMEPVTVWVCLIYIFGFCVLRGQVAKDNMEDYNYSDSDEYEIIVDWMRKHVPGEAEWVI